MERRHGNWLPSSIDCQKGGRGGRGTDRDQQTLGVGGAGPAVPILDSTVTCHRHGHVCPTPSCRCQAGIRSPHTADTRVAETLTDKHITYKGGQPSADGDTDTSHTKTQG